MTLSVRIPALFDLKSLTRKAAILKGTTSVACALPEVGRLVVPHTFR
jgi:hypothetical protein